jgi:hypothetical protein
MAAPLSHMAPIRRTPWSHSAISQSFTKGGFESPAALASTVAAPAVALRQTAK